MGFGPFLVCRHKVKFRMAKKLSDSHTLSITGKQMGPNW
jgi:hypothetical protein